MTLPVNSERIKCSKRPNHAAVAAVYVQWCQAAQRQVRLTADEEINSIGSPARSHFTTLWNECVFY